MAKEYVPVLTEEEKKVPELIIEACGHIYHFSYGCLVMFVY